ncbi:MAG: AAA family ATPase [Planctomycetota bacterium]
MTEIDRARTAGPRIIAMLNQKGGVGKTTSTVNLGAALARAGQHVCMLDLDPQGHLTLHLGVEADDIEHTVYDLLIDPDVPAEDALIRNARERLDVILADVDLAGAEPELANVPDRQSILRRKMAPIINRYDVILIDCPPSLGLLTLNALTLAHEVFVPMQAHFLALQGVGKLLETVGLVCQSVNTDLRVSGILLCMHEAQTTLAREVVSDIDAFFTAARDQDVPWNACHVIRPAIRRNIKLAEAPSFGNTIFDYAPWCPGALDYAKIADNLLERWTKEDAANGITRVCEAYDPPVDETPAPTDDDHPDEHIATASPTHDVETFTPPEPTPADTPPINPPAPVHQTFESKPPPTAPPVSAPPPSTHQFAVPPPTSYQPPAPPIVETPRPFDPSRPDALSSAGDDTDPTYT